ncbi:hypothetical protein HYT55_00240 [Candidatus Woesearchaeota archaeon]|nr:hypothetical protein [Candidatus Woesearchaeota archaeon]
MKAITYAAANFGLLLALYTTRCSLPTEGKINVETITQYRQEDSEDEAGKYYEPGFEITSQTPFSYQFLRAQTYNDYGLDVLPVGNLLIYDHRCDGRVEKVVLEQLRENLLPDAGLQQSTEVVLKTVKNDLGLPSYCTIRKGKKAFIRRGVPLADQTSSSSQF